MFWIMFLIGLRGVAVAMVKICPFKNLECLHPDWADCQYEFSIGDEEYAKLWFNRKEDEMGRNCVWLPKGITRTEMMKALGAYGEKRKVEVLENIKKGRYGKKKRLPPK